MGEGRKRLQNTQWTQTSRSTVPRTITAPSHNKTRDKIARSTKPRSVIEPSNILRSILIIINFH